ncbi:hypothetical protein SAMN05216223_12910 [Actinacidiphila yanglinensis]|uniref:Asp23/Gls24 family envelope stress response protein n=1 Tax=Actinacidiphila yanglinensis TaxID=310779 RepID=A0A1H6E9T4_9ACTN|nr:hypothetical protein [Actinacidiphila yanglinensis]SEG94003.1 hypothetical protein SAMN05216223_12910 [Actinacidiphila yanglinensis]
MVATDITSVERTAADAALSVPGVLELQPTLGQSLVGAVTSIRQALGSSTQSPGAGIHAERGADGSWHFEVRCVVTDHRRVLDTARVVHDLVQATVAPHTARHGNRVPVTVTVAVTGITSSLPSQQPATTAP